MTHKGEGFTLIPTECPRFVAMCATLGVELVPGTPGVSNVYDVSRKYDPEEPGNVSFYLSDKNGINPLAVAKVWLNPDDELQECALLPQRLLARHDPESWKKLADDIETLHVTGAVATVRKFTQNKFPVDSRSISDAEIRAAQVMSGFSEAMTRDESRRGDKHAARLSENWNASMFCWVKAWIQNYTETKDAWQSARPAIKIEREGRFPLIVPRGRDFAKLLRKWI